jgi:two-component system chemotaxis response regulator CheY
MKILIVDDEITNCTILEKILTPYGECRSVMNGEDAISAFEEACSTEESRYSLICLDIMMPGMDGHEVLQKIRSVEGTLPEEQRCKIMMITALGDLVNVTEAFRKECDSYLVKPFNTAQVKERMEKMGFER